MLPELAFYFGRLFATLSALLVFLCKCVELVTGD